MVTGVVAAGLPVDIPGTRAVTSTTTVTVCLVLIAAATPSSPTLRPLEMSATVASAVPFPPTPYPGPTAVAGATAIVAGRPEVLSKTPQINAEKLEDARVVVKSSVCKGRATNCA